ncbi:MAG: RND family transporter [Planctomycetaceae bacterium]
MTHFFEKRDRWGNGMALWVLLGMVFLVPWAVWSLRKIDLHNDVENWLPKDDPQSRVLAWYREQFPVEDRILVSWKGSTLNDHRVKRLADKLEGKRDAHGVRHGGIPYFKHVITPQEVIAGIQTSSKGTVETAEAIRRMEGVLIGSGMLKVELTAAGMRRKEAVQRMIVERAREQLGVELDVAGRLVDTPVPFRESDADPEPAGGESEGAVEVYREFDPAPEHHLQLAFRGMKPGARRTEQLREVLKNVRGRKTKQHPEGEPLVDRCFFFPGSPVALFVTLSEAGKEAPRDAIAALRAAAQDVGIPEKELHLGGRSVAGSELNREVKNSAWNRGYSLLLLHRRSPLLLSLIVGVALAFLMLRSARLATLVLIVAGYTVLVTVSLVPITHGSMNMVLVVMPTLLYVLTISAAIHVANYWKHAAHRNLRTAVVEAVTMARQPCVLAGVTTAIGLASLMTSPLRPVRDFGLYSAIGCLIALVVVLYCLPALLQFWPARQPKPREIERAGWKAIAGWLVRFRMPVTLFFLAAFGVCVYGLKDFRTETKVIKYFPDDARVVTDYHFLEDKLAGIIPVDVVVRFQKPGDGETGPDFLQRMEIVRNIEEKLRKHKEISGVIALPDFQQVRKPLPEDAGRTARFTYNGRVSDAETRAKADGSKARPFLTVAKRRFELNMDRNREFNVAEGDELWRITAQVAVMSDANYTDLTRELNDIAQQELRYHPGANHVVTGMVPVFLRTQQAVLDSLIRSFGIAFAVIAVVMMVVLRNPVSGLITMLPNLLPVGIVFGLISWARLPVDIGTMITASVALGIAVDGTLHLLTWFKSGILEGRSRKQAIEGALMHCGPAMWQTSAAVGIGLLMLAPAELLLIHRFGWLMAALIGAALVADVLFLPALLAGPLGTLIERTTRGKTPALQQPEKPPEPDACPSSSPAAEPHVLKMQRANGRILRID